MTRTWIAAIGLASLAFNGCTLYELPDNPPAHNAVFEAAKAVVAEHYTLRSALPRSGVVFGISDMGMQGNNKTLTTVSVRVSQTFTGGHVPLVRVTRYVELGEPIIDSQVLDLRRDPQSPSPIHARPIAHQRWQSLGYVAGEEVKIRNEIMARVGALKKPATGEGGGAEKNASA